MIISTHTYNDDVYIYIYTQPLKKLDLVKAFQENTQFHLPAAAVTLKFN